MTTQPVPLEITTSPQRIFDLIGTLQTAKYLFVADEVNLFDQLADGPLPLSGVAHRIGYPTRTARILLDALVATGFLAKDELVYRNSALADAYLTTKGMADLRPMLRLWKHLVHQQWQALEKGLRLDEATLAFGNLSANDRQVFSHGVSALTASTAERLAACYDFSAHHQLLDLWGGLGAFSKAAQQTNPALRVALFELPATAALARAHWATSLHMPITVVEGHLLTDSIPSGYDVLVLANIVHLFGPERNQALFSRIRQAVEPGARLLVVDFWTNPSRTEPVFAALMAGEFVVFAGEGDVYSRQEVEEWLANTGWQAIDFHPLTATTSVIVAEAR